MKPKLPRVLLWSEINDLSKFLEEPINRELLDLFDFQEFKFFDGIKYPTIRLLNEVYYQCTRIFYEQDSNILTDEITSDIKANMGVLNNAKAVYLLICYLLSHRIGNTPIVNLFKERFKQLSGFYNDKFKNIIDDWDKSEKYIIPLSPKPIPASMLDSIFLDWQEITCNYDKDSIRCICDLYAEDEDKLNFLLLIENSFSRYLMSCNIPELELVKFYPNIADMRFIYDLEDVVGNRINEKFDEEHKEKAEIKKLSYEKLQEAYIKANKRLDGALSEIESLKSNLNMSKPKEQQETSFTLSLIVDYCKNMPEYSDVKDIVAMLYKFTKKCPDSDEKLVDSITAHFNNKKYGNTFNNATLTMPNAQIQEVYHVSGNENVNFGEYQDGEEE